METQNATMSYKIVCRAKKKKRGERKEFFALALFFRRRGENPGRIICETGNPVLLQPGAEGTQGVSGTGAVM